MSTAKAKESAGVPQDVKWQVGGKRMNPKIDYKKLLAQEPEVEEYFKEVLYLYQRSESGFKQMAEFLHGFYQLDIPPAEVVKLLKKWER